MTVHSWTRPPVVSRKSAGGYLSAVGFAPYATSLVGRSVTAISAAQVSAVLRAIRIVSEGVAMLPVQVVRERVEDGRRVSVRATGEKADRIARLLTVRPNAWQTPFEFREYAIIAAMLDGGFLAIKLRAASDRRILSLIPVPIGAWGVRQEQDLSLNFTVAYADQTRADFRLDDVFYLRGPSLDNHTGLDVVRAVRNAIGLTASLEDQQARLAEEGGKPSGVLSFEDNLPKDKLEAIEAAWRAKFGPGGRGGTAILDKAAKFHAMTMTSVDMQHIEQRKFQIEEIARAFGVFPQLLMQSDKASTFASAEQFFRAHITHTLGPWIRRFEEVCLRDLLELDDELRVDLQERALLRGDFKDQADYFSAALGSGGAPGWLTPNEVRQEMGLNPIPDPEADQLPRGVMNVRGEQTTAPGDGR